MNPNPKESARTESVDVETEPVQSVEMPTAPDQIMPSPPTEEENLVEKNPPMLSRPEHVPLVVTEEKPKEAETPKTDTHFLDRFKSVDNISEAEALTNAMNDSQIN